MAAFQEADFIPWRSPALINVPLLLAATQHWPNPAHNATFYLSVTTVAKHSLHIFRLHGRLADTADESEYWIWFAPKQNSTLFYYLLRAAKEILFFFFSNKPRLFKKRTIPRIPGCWLIKLVICAIKACTWISIVRRSFCTKWHVSKYWRALQHRRFCI